MSKQSAIGANLYLGVYDLSGDVGVVTKIGSPRGTIGQTAIKSPAEERILTTRDGAMGFSGFWNTATGQIFDALSAMPRTDLLASLAIPTAAATLAIGDVGCALNGKQITFDQTVGQDKSLGVSTEIQANGTALEWGRLLTAGKETRGTGTVNGTGIDDGASTSFGWAAYLHVFSMPSGTLGVKLQDSGDDATYNDLTGGGFTNVTGATSERIAGAHTATVNEFVRLVTTGTHGNALLAVLFVRYLSDQAL